MTDTISDHFDSVITTASIVAVRTNALAQLAPASRAAACTEVGMRADDAGAQRAVTSSCGVDRCTPAARQEVVSR